MKFLIDECLSPALVQDARRIGIEAYHLAHLGRASSEDWEVVALAVARDLVLVTNNGSDFRRLYAAQELHPGLVILVPNAERDTQLRLFRAALVRLAEIGDLTNKALEVDLARNGVESREYGIARRTGP